MSESLPQGWEWALLDDVSINFDGLRIPVKAADRAEMTGEYPYYGASGVIDRVDDYLFEGRYLLVSEDGANLLARNKPIAFEAAGRFWVNNHAHVLQAAPGVEQRFLLHALERLDLSRYISGSAQPKLTQRNLKRIPVPIPPGQEQRRIVAAIEEHFSRLDAAEASLQRAAQRLEVLAIAQLAVLVGAAPTAKASEFATDLRYGTSVKCSYDAVGPPVLRIPNIASGELSLDDIKFATDPSKVGDSVMASPGDLLFVRTNGSPRLIGRTACVPRGEPWAFASYLIGMTVDPQRALPEFLNLVMHAPGVRRQLIAAASTSAGQLNLSIGKIERVEVPLPSLPEQASIVEEMARLKAEEGHVAHEVSAAVRRAAQLRRSVLSAAFSGQLVPQDPAEEPASVLLERIAAERAAAKPSRRKKAAK